jgi:hypothetical protein
MDRILTKVQILDWVLWLISIIPETQEAEGRRLGRTRLEAGPGEKVNKTSHLNKQARYGDACWDLSFVAEHIYEDPRLKQA